MKDNYRFVLLLPFLIFGIGVQLYFQTENEVRVQMARAQAEWRSGSYDEAIALYELVASQYPASRYADDALWEAATIYYFNYNEVNRALSEFQKLVDMYPGTPLAKEAHLKLAEINEVAMRDPETAIEHWKQALVQDSSIRNRRLIHFRMGTAYLKWNKFDEALAHFEIVVTEGPEDHLSDQTRIRLGTIWQIKRKYEASLPLFEQVLAHSECGDCLIRAKLGLIESYEFMDDLPKAIAEAETMPEQYPENSRRDLLRRLKDKDRYYGQKLGSAP